MLKGLSNKIQNDYQENKNIIFFLPALKKLKKLFVMEENKVYQQ